jgi:hypothetical protein
MNDKPIDFQLLPSSPSSASWWVSAETNEMLVSGGERCKKSSLEFPSS